MTGQTIDHGRTSLTDLRASYVASSTDAMPIAGVIAWSVLALLALWLGPALPYWAVLVAPAAPLPLAVLIDKARGRPTIFDGDASHPMTGLFLQFMSVIGVFVFLVIAIAKGPAALALGIGIVSGLIWVPHGWSAGSRAGMVQFVLRAVLCFAAYFLAPSGLKVPAIAAAVALSYVHAILFVRGQVRA